MFNLILYPLRRGAPYLTHLTGRTIMPQLSRLMIACLLAAALPLAGCDSKASKAKDEKAAAPPASVQPTEVQGISRITLTEQAAQRIGIQVEAAQAASKGVVVPYSALLYEASGSEWVYTNPEPLVFKRAAVKVERIDGDKMYLAKGPAHGTKVVIVGAAELFGAEFEIGH